MRLTRYQNRPSRTRQQQATDWLDPGSRDSLPIKIGHRVLVSSRPPIGLVQDRETHQLSKQAIAHSSAACHRSAWSRIERLTCYQNRPSRTRQQQATDRLGPGSRDSQTIKTGHRALVSSRPSPGSRDSQTIKTGHRALISSRPSIGLVQDRETHILPKQAIAHSSAAGSRSTWSRIERLTNYQSRPSRTRQQQAVDRLGPRSRHSLPIKAGRRALVSSRQSIGLVQDRETHKLSKQAIAH